MSIHLALEKTHELSEEIDWIENRLDNLRSKCDRVLSALEHGENSADQYLFSKFLKSINYINNPSDFNWCMMGTSVNIKRLVLCHVIVQEGVMYGTNGVSVSFCDTNLPDGVYEANECISTRNLNPPKMQEVIKTNKTSVFKKFKIEDLVFEHESVKIFNRKFDKTLFNLVITNSQEFKASINKNGALTIDLENGRKALIMCRRGED